MAATMRLLPRQARRHMAVRRRRAAVRRSLAARRMKVEARHMAGRVLRTLTRLRRRHIPFPRFPARRDHHRDRAADRDNTLEANRHFLSRLWLSLKRAVGAFRTSSRNAMRGLVLLLFILPTLARAQDVTRGKVMAERLLSVPKK